MNYEYGSSLDELEALNLFASQNNEHYKNARETYSKILDNVADFISDNAPVVTLIISRENYNYINPFECDPNDLTTYCLSIVYISHNELLFTKKCETIYHFTMTNELYYVLCSEGWEHYPIKFGEYFYLNVKGCGRKIV